MAYKGFLLVLIGLNICACGTVERGTIPWEETDSNTTVDKTAPDPSVSTTEETSAPLSEYQEYLQLAYNDWKGIPYLLGGSDYNGIDCSAFMQVVFEDYLMRMIPRTTQEQLLAGKQVNKNDIRTADLVFFKTGFRSYHVGVMINKSEFLHASTTEGVKISELNHPYWQKRYYSARRLL